MVLIHSVTKCQSADTLTITMANFEHYCSVITKLELKLEQKENVINLSKPAADTYEMS